MPDGLTIYYDYTCPYSYRAFRWLQHLKQSGRVFELQWKTFSLKEANRDDDAPSVFDLKPVDSVSILALELAKATQAAGGEMFERYHGVIFDAMHGDGKKLAADAVRTMAQDAGLEMPAFQAEQQAGTWLQRVAGDHRDGVGRWNVFGTPTLVFDDQAAVYLKFTRVPQSPSDAAEVFDALRCLARCHPELVEIKQPPAS